MAEEFELGRRKLKGLLKVINPASPEQDSSCPHIFWLGDDLAHVSTGNWHCSLRERTIPGEYGGPPEEETDVCGQPHYPDCPHRQTYLNNLKIEGH